jgi:hypothetical protein
MNQKELLSYVTKRFLIYSGLIILSGLYYLFASQNILQFLKAIPQDNILIGLTKPITLTGISIIAYIAGLFLRSNKAEVWSQRLIFICVLVAIVPYALPFLTGTNTESNSEYLQYEDAKIPAVSSQSNFDALVTLAKGGDLDSIMTVAHLYCLGCDASVKLDLRDPSEIPKNAHPEDLSKYEIPNENIKEAFSWYEAAARMGSLKAKNILGEMLVRGVGVLQNMSKALQLFNESAKKGYVPAQFNLAAMYEYGYGVEKDILQAHMWYNIIASGAKDHLDADALYAKALRGALEPKMGTAAVAEAGEKAKLCVESKLQNCR